MAWLVWPMNASERSPSRLRLGSLFSRWLSLVLSACMSN